MKKIYRLKNLDCAHCADKMQRSIAKVKGVNDIKITFMTQRMTIDIDDKADESEIMQQVKKIISQTEKNCTIEE